jgi:DNA processing protein
MEEFLFATKEPAAKEKFMPNQTDPIRPMLSPDESLVVDAMEPYPIHIDELARTLSMEPGKLSNILLRLELKGMIEQSPGKFFVLIK